MGAKFGVEAGRGHVMHPLPFALVTGLSWAAGRFEEHNWRISASGSCTSIQWVD